MVMHGLITWIMMTMDQKLKWEGTVQDSSIQERIDSMDCILYTTGLRGCCLKQLIRDSNSR